MTRHKFLVNKLINSNVIIVVKNNFISFANNVMNTYAFHAITCCIEEATELCMIAFE